MKKIILAFEGNNFSNAAFQFASQLNKMRPLFLTGVFLPQAMLSSAWSYAEPGSGATFIPMMEAEKSELILQNIARFEKLCNENGIAYQVHKDFYDLALSGLRHESRFADLVILGSQDFYNNPGSDEISDMLEFALKDFQCPVIVVPDEFKFPESIILSYDGSDNSVFAIRQFSYVFPELTSLETLLVFADEHINREIPDKKLIEEFAQRHFKQLTIFKLDANPGKYFSTWVSEKRAPLLVSGSYGKRRFPGILKKHFLNDVIAEHRIPVFIVHR